MVIDKSCQLQIPLNDAIGMNDERLPAFVRNDEACTRRNESNVLILLRANNLLLLISLAILVSMNYSFNPSNKKPTATMKTTTTTKNWSTRISYSSGIYFVVVCFYNCVWYC